MANAENAEWHSEHGVLYKILYMVPIFFNFRMRIYAGFTLSEVNCDQKTPLLHCKSGCFVRYLASWLALGHIPPLLNQGLGRDLPSSQSSGVRERRWIMQGKWIINLIIGLAFVSSNNFQLLESFFFAGELWSCAQYRRVGSRFRPLNERSSQMLEHDCKTPF